MARSVLLSQELFATTYSLINPVAINTQGTRNFRFNYKRIRFDWAMIDQCQPNFNWAIHPYLTVCPVLMVLAVARIKDETRCDMLEQRDLLISTPSNTSLSYAPEWKLAEVPIFLTSCLNYYARAPAKS